jgi:hypothetical protein
VENAGGHVPACAHIQAIGLGQIRDAVVALVPALQTVTHLFPAGAGLESEESVREVGAIIVELGWEEVRLRFLLLANPGSVLRHVVHVMGQRALVVEELGINGPAAVTVPHLVAQQPGAQVGYHILEQHLLWVVVIAVNNVAQALVGRCQGAVISLGRRREPAFVDAAAVRAKRIVVFGV